MFDNEISQNKRIDSSINASENIYFNFNVKIALMINIWPLKAHFQQITSYLSQILKNNKV